MKQILIVDDNKLNLAAAKNALSDLYRIAAVLSGAQALKFLEKNTPDLILLDINMPEMNGFEVMDQLRSDEMLHRIPVVFLTADTEAETEIRCLQCGAQDFIAKPFVPEVMRSRIGRILELDELRRNLAERLDQKIQEVSDIKSRSYRDALTGLWNRAYTEEKVSELLKTERSGCLLMMDMDNFKAINDNYGHIAGDHTLKQFAETLQRYAAQEDVLCRIGGDEFMLYAAGDPSHADICKRAEAIIADMAAMLKECRFETNSSVSVGIAQFPDDGDDFTSLYNAADKALYHVKQNGKNSYHFFKDHHAAQSSRASGKTDLPYLHQTMMRADGTPGAYRMEYDSFHHVYHFVRRLSESGHCVVQTVLFTLRESPESAAAESAMELLEHTIGTALRRADIVTRYSSCQAIVLLTGTDRANAVRTAERILAQYDALSENGLHFDFDIMTMA